MGRWRGRIDQAKRYPSFIIGVIIILFFVVLSVYAVIAVPYSESIAMWRGGPG